MCPDANVVLPKGHRLTHPRVAHPVRSLSLCTCHIEKNGEIKPSDHVTVLTAAALQAAYPYGTWRYARGGDYVGLIAQYLTRKRRQVVDFHITPSHVHLKDEKWLNRVIQICRVMAVEV